ncbi:MAG: hypothetical protein NC489_26305 [Ruminococcus flavefaciens]|nr:hypothetical protein [Ruminococcus flavefaciens]
MYEKTISILRQHEIKMETGLTFAEICKVESIYEIKFPKSLRAFLMQVLPTSKGFYNWRDFNPENIEFIWRTIERPKNDLFVGRAEEALNGSESDADMKIQLKNAPKMIPIYFHRYIPVISRDDPPVLSVHGMDIIYYGENLDDYFEVEFGGKKQEEIDFEKIEPVPFWTDMMGYY